MKHRIQSLASLILLLLLVQPALPQESVAVVAPPSEAGEGLDLQVVGELFKEAENLEAFEKALNDPESGVNNLDLNEDDEVDYVRVVEEAADDTRVIILQAALAENEFQDVATIELEKESDEKYNMQVHGNDEIYGADYYVAPAHVHVHTWPIIHWMYRPLYRPYRSTFYYGFYPRWWRPFRPVHVNVYRTRTVHFRTRPTFAATRTTRVRTVTRVNYKPRTSTHVRKRTTVTRKASVTRKNPKTGKTTTVKAGAKRTKNPRTGKTTTKVGVKKTTKTKGGKKTTRAKGAKKTKVKKGGKRRR